MRCAECTDRMMRFGELRDVVDPVNWKPLERLSSFFTVHVLDESSDLDTIQIRRHISDFRREGACAEDEEFHRGHQPEAMVRATRCTSSSVRHICIGSERTRDENDSAPGRSDRSYIGYSSFRR